MLTSCSMVLHISALKYFMLIFQSKSSFVVIYFAGIIVDLHNKSTQRETEGIQSCVQKIFRVSGVL